MPDLPTRPEWMAVLSKAPAGALVRSFAALGAPPAFDWLRAPETGTVMVRGRAGGTGDAFNLGEMTVTRCALRLADGTVGHGWVPGRDGATAEAAALCDALLQTDRAPEIATQVLAPLAQARTDGRATLARKAEATKVDFFTMVRGENA